MDTTTVTIFSFTIYDIKTDTRVLSPRKGTLEAIAAVNGVVIEKTAEEVQASQLDGNGFTKSA